MSGWVPGVVVSTALIATYLLVLRRRPVGLPAWPVWRTVAWVVGAVMVAAALAPQLSAAATTDHRAHMVQHLLLGMYAPIGLVAAAPVSLLLGSLPTAAARRVTRLLRASAVRVVTHPVAAAVLNVGALFALYLTPLHHRAAGSGALSALVLLHFLLAGWLYTWAIAGPDPVPHRPRLATHVAVLVVAAGAHAYLAKTLYARAAEGHHHGMSHAEAAAQLMYYGGDGAEILLAVLLFAGWYHRVRPRAHVPVTA